MTPDNIAKTAKILCAAHTNVGGRQTFEFDFHGLEKFVKHMIQDEREDCASICDVLSVHPQYASDTIKMAARAIRARGNK